MIIGNKEKIKDKLLSSSHSVNKKCKNTSITKSGKISPINTNKNLLKAPDKADFLSNPGDSISENESYIILESKLNINNSNKT